MSEPVPPAEMPAGGLIAEQVLAELEPYLGHLPEAVRLVVWGDAQLSRGEKEAVRLAASLAHRFPALQCEVRPRRINYDFYPVVGVMGVAQDEEVDYRVRFIGPPLGVQINSLVGAIQAVSFRASNLEARTRVLLNRLPEAVALELFTDANDEGGAILGTLISGMAVAGPQIQTYVVMADYFPESAVRYSIRTMPYTVINRRYHVEGMYDEGTLLTHISRAIERGYRQQEAG